MSEETLDHNYSSYLDQIRVLADAEINKDKQKYDQRRTSQEL